PAGRAAQPAHLIPGELLRAQQPLQHTRREGGMAPAALTGDHNAPLLPSAISRCHGHSLTTPGKPRSHQPAPAPYPCPRSPGQETSAGSVVPGQTTVTAPDAGGLRVPG